MSITKTILCLANSRKLHGRCVAGLVLENGETGWLRPVSSREHREVSEYERQYEDGSDPRVLDIIEVPLIKPMPDSYQQENWLLDGGKYWRHVGKAKWDDLTQETKHRGPLSHNGCSTYNGENDQIPLGNAADLQTSLELIHLDTLQLRVFAPSAAFGNPKRRVQARFYFSGVQYRLWVTDPLVERKYLAGPDGQHDLGECFLTVSLGEPFNDHCHKLVAAILEKPR